MAHVEQPIKDYGRKVDLIRKREYHVTPTPILWQSENNNLIYQAFMVLQAGLVAVPLIAGMDKFVNLIVDWPQYVSPALPQLTNLSMTSFMYVAGAAEIAIAIGVALMPRIFSWVLMVWLGGIIINLLMLGQFYDVALRDFGLMLASFALWRLSLIKEEVPVVVTDDVMDFNSPELAH